MRLNSQETADLVKFTEEILKAKLHFLCSKLQIQQIISDGHDNNETIGA